MLTYLLEKSIENRTLVVLVALMVSALGIWATLNTPVDAIPDLSDVQVIIKTDYLGQDPRIVEDQVTYPLASAMLSVPFAHTVRGYSMFGSSYVYIIFEDGTDLYWARSRVLEYLSQVSGTLPDGVRPTIGPDATGVGWVFQYSLRDTTGTHDLSDLRAVQDFFLSYELQAVEGVAEVAAIGGFRKQYQVVLDPQRLAAYGISTEHVAMRLMDSNRDVGGRIVELGEREFMVRGRGYIRGLDDIRSIPLVSSRGGRVTIGDVALVREGPELRRGIAESNGEGEVVGGIVIMRYGGNALDVIERVKTRLAEITPGLPAGVTVQVEYDRSRLIREAVHTLQLKLWQELAVVALIVLLFLLHVRSAFVAVVTVPVGILMALLAMRLMGMNANIMSLGGIAIAIGVMVDAALVMVENAHKHLEKPGAERLKAIRDAAVEVGPSLFFSLIVITVSFMPVFTLEQVEGRLFGPLAWTKTFAMASAALLAVTLVPALMAFLIRGRIRTETDNPVSRVLLAAFRPVVRVAIRFPKSVLMVAGLLLALTIVPYSRLGSEFMPALNEGDLLYMPSTLPGVTPQKAKELLQETDRIIKSFPEVASVFGKAGRAGTATDPAPLSMFETTIILKPRDQWRPGVTQDSLVQALDAAIRIPGLTNMWTMPIKTRTDMLATGIKTPIGIKIAGADLRELERLGGEVEELLRPLAGARSVVADRTMGGTYLDIDVDRFEAGRYGLTTGQVLNTVSMAVGGMNITSTVEGLERHPVNIRYAQSLREDPESLGRVLVPTPSGAQVPLGQLATISLTDGPAMIKSENARPNAWVLVDLEPGQDVGSFVARARDVIARDLDLPAGYSLAWSGQFEYMERANDRLKVIVPLTLLIIFLLLFIHLKRLSHVAMIMLTLPFAVVGGVWLLALLQYDLSIAVAVGFIAVAGLAVETGVVMLVYIREAVERHRTDGLLTTRAEVRAAVEEGSVLRIRPLLMTVITTLLALLPIMFGTGTGAEVMQRIAAPMVGGLVSATILTLMVLPAMYVLVQRTDRPSQ
ncbi:MAG: CusA/CzcA family heavy metal efflux RND transporter [Rhodothermales bacterium]